MKRRSAHPRPNLYNKQIYHRMLKPLKFVSYNEKKKKAYLEEDTEIVNKFLKS